MFCSGRPGVVRVGVDVDRGWVDLRVSPGLVSSRFVSAMLLPVVYGREGVRAVMQCCPVLEIDGWWCCSALYCPWQGRENTGDGGRAAETIGGHSMQAVRGGLSTRHNSRATI